MASFVRGLKRVAVAIRLKFDEPKFVGPLFFALDREREKKKVQRIRVKHARDRSFQIEARSFCLTPSKDQFHVRR